MNYQTPVTEHSQTYKQYMQSQGKLPKTIQSYLGLLKLYNHTPGQNTQQKINNYVEAHNYPLALSFLKDYVMHYQKNREYLDWPRIRKKPVERKSPVKKKEIQLMIEQWTSRNTHRDRAIMAVFFSTGARCEELSLLKWEDVNFETRIVDIRKGKGAKARITILDIGTMDILLDYKRLQAEIEDLTDKRVFALTPRRIHGIIKQMSNNRIHPHLIRSGTATHMLEKGFTILEVKEYLGHEDIKTTQKYVKVLDKHKLLERMKINF